MIIATVQIQLRPERLKDVLGVLRWAVGRVRVQPGCLGCVLKQDVLDESNVTFEQEWASDGELSEFLASDLYRKVLDGLEISGEKPVFRFRTVSRSQGIEVVEAARGSNGAKPKRKGRSTRKSEHHAAAGGR